MFERRGPFHYSLRVPGCLAWILLAACGPSADADRTGESSVLGVTVHVVRRETLRDVANASGTVVPATAGDWTIYAPEVAEIVELPKAEGEKVATGDLLARFEIASRTQLLAALQLETIAAQQALDRSAAELARQTGLAERGLVARSAFEQTRAQHSAATSQLDQIRERLQTAQAAQDISVVRARFPGVVAQVFHAKGDIVAGAADPVLRVIDPSRVQISIQLPLAQLARVVPGQAASVRAIAGETAQPATVVLTPPVADPSAATGEVRLSLQNPLVVLPLDTPVSVELLLDIRTAAIAVPNAAIQRDDVGPYVMLANGSGVAERRNVRVGLVSADLSQIASGVEENERVVTSGLTHESDGLRVTIVQ